MSDDRREEEKSTEEKIVDEILRPAEPLGDKRTAHARRRSPSTRRSGTGRRSGRRGGRFLAWFLILGLLAGGSWLGWRLLHPGLEERDFPMAEDEFTAVAGSSGDRAVVLVFPEWDASGYVTEERQIPSRDRGGEDLLDIMQVLCRGPVVSGAVSAFPAGTQALGAFFNPEDSSVVLDFSEELVTGHPGGSAAEVATLTSILRTVALNFPDTRSCVILVGGSQVETLAGHLTMDRPFDPRRWL